MLSGAREGRQGNTGGGRGARGEQSTTLLRGTLGFIHNFLQVYLRRYLLHIYVFATVTGHRVRFLFFLYVSGERA